MPRVAKPSARSRNTLTPPTLSSRSLGARAVYQHHRGGHGPFPFGTVSVPGSFHSSPPTVAS